MVIQLSDQTFDQAVLSDTPHLVEFRSDWCAACQQMEHVLDALASELAGAIFVSTIDIGLHREVRERYGIRSLPTFILFRNGAILARTSGAKNSSQLRRLIAAHR